MRRAAQYENQSRTPKTAAVVALSISRRGRRPEARYRHRLDDIMFVTPTTAP